MNAADIWNSMPRRIVAILRGLQPDETEAVIIALIVAGIRAIEIPLNRPHAMQSVEIAVRSAQMAGQACLVGAGTVLSAAAVRQVHEAGGNLIVAPNHDPQVVRAARSAAMVTLPGVFTATEALAALADGATGLKFFPASVLGPSGVAAIGTMKTVLSSSSSSTVFPSGRKHPHFPADLLFPASTVLALFYLPRPLCIFGEIPQETASGATPETKRPLAPRARRRIPRTHIPKQPTLLTLDVERE